MAAEQDNSAAQFNLAMAYAAGSGVPQDNVQAYMWLSLGTDPYDELLDSLARKMSTAELEQAEKLASEWTPKSAPGAKAERQP